MIVYTMRELMFIDVLISAVDDQPGWNCVPTAVKVLRQEGALFVRWHVVVT